MLTVPILKIGLTNKDNKNISTKGLTLFDNK